MKEKRVKKKSRIRRAVVLSLIVLITVYSMIACLPYAGKLEISGTLKNSYNTADFFGDAPTPERVMMLDDSQSAFIHRIDIIERAQSEINFVTFSTHDGDTTDIFFAALIKAARRGVKVNILLDAKLNGLSGKMIYALNGEDNIKIYGFNGFNFFKPYMLHVALHDKFITCDNEYLILGGRNIGDKYYLGGEGGTYASLDREVLVYNTSPEDFEGAIRQVRDYFGKLIDCSLSKGIDKENTAKGAAKATDIEKKYDRYKADYSAGTIDYALLTEPTNRITLVTNPIEGAKKEPVIAYTLYRLAMDSDKVVIQSPYTVLTKDNLKYLAEIAANCSEFKLLTNSLASTPNLPAFSNYYVNRGKILETGIEIYEYQMTSSSIHAKSVLFDSRLTAVGSFNLDERSIRIDTESMLIIDSYEFYGVAEETLEIYFDKSLKVAKDGSYEPSGNVPPADASTFKKILYNVAGFILNVAKYLL